MKKFAIVYREKAHLNQSNIALHADGCKDIQREIRQQGGYVEKIEAKDVKGALDYIMQDLIDGGFEPGAYRPEDIDVLPCCNRG